MSGSTRTGAGLLATLVALLSACLEEDPAGEPPARVLLVTWDTVRADQTGPYGADEAATPGLDALARKGVVFERAYAPTPITLPSHTSLLTGVAPPAHGVRDNRVFRLRAEARLLSEALKEQGFRTAAFVGSYILDPKYGLDQGFERYTSPEA